MTDEVEGNFENNIIYQFWKKGINSKKIRHHCHLTGQYRGPAHHKWRKKFYTEKSNFIPFVSDNFFNFDCHLFFEKLVDMKKRWSKKWWNSEKQMKSIHQ